MSQSMNQAAQDREIIMSNAGSRVTRVYIYAGPLLRMGLEQVLDETRFVVVDSTSDLPSSGQAFQHQRPELIIIDEKYRPGATTELIAELKASHPDARILLLADRFEFNTIVSSRYAGVNGFCLTTSNRDVLIHCIELVMLGVLVVQSELALAVVADTMNGVDFLPERSQDNAPNKPLSNREVEVLSWLREGASNKVIARSLNVSEATIKVHVKAILRKIGARNRAQAAIWAAYHLPQEQTNEQ